VSVVVPPTRAFANAARAIDDVGYFKFEVACRVLSLNYGHGAKKQFLIFDGNAIASILW
jgi:hypothetical protein